MRTLDGAHFLEQTLAAYHAARARRG
jgi:hypothetical protein